MKVLAYTTTTSDYPFIKYLGIALASLRQFNQFPIIVFVLDKGIEDVRRITNQFKDVSLVDFSDCKTSKLHLELTCRAKDIFTFSSDLSVLVGPECLDYCYEKYDYDILFRFDTDVLFTAPIDFQNFYRSGKAFGGCEELYWHIWSKETFGFSVTDDPVYNVGLSMFRKDKQVPNMHERMLEYFQSVNYKVNTFEQDAINYVCKDVYDLNEQFVLATNREVSLQGKTAFHFNGVHLKPLKLRLLKHYDFLVPIYQKWNTFVHDKELDFELKRKAFYSSCDGDKFIDLLIVTVTSYKKHNTLPIDWIVICKNHAGMDGVRKRTEFLTDEKVRMVYAVMPEPPAQIDYKKYNSFKWTSDYACEIFCKRVYFVDVWKSRYDLMVCVDLDCLFVGDVEPEIRDFMDSGCAVGGTSEPFLLRYGFESRLKRQMPSTNYCFDKYINFGFGMLNTRLLRDDNFMRFASISKGCEDFFNTQEQAYFACEYQQSIKVYPGLQCLVWGRINDKKYCHHYDYKVIHFSPAKFLTDDISRLDPSDYAYAMTILFYRQYAGTVLGSNVSGQFKKLTLRNLGILGSLGSQIEKIKLKKWLTI